MIGNKAYYASSKLFKSALLSTSTTLKLYRILTRLVVTYASETLTLNTSDENALQVLERKVIRKIYCPVCEDSAWRLRSNSEINSLLWGGGGTK
jgi:hypothetical protein